MALDNKTSSEALREKQEWKNTLATVLLALGCLLFLFFETAPHYGLLAGMGIALLLGNPIGRLTSKTSGILLKLSIVMLGAGMNLGVVWYVGVSGFGYTFVSLTVTMLCGIWIGKKMRLGNDISLLLSTGTAICGGSAIAAMSGVIKPKSHDMTVALSVVFLLNAVALFLVPPIGRMLGLDQESFGLWSALAIHDTSSVVGAASTFGATALGVAVTVKLARTLWIVPMTVLVSILRKPEEGKRRFQAKRLIPPLFIIGYLAMAALFTWAPIEEMAKAVPVFTSLAHRGMTAALFLIGAGLSVQALRETGIRPLIAGIILWVLVLITTAVAISVGWISL